MILEQLYTELFKQKTKFNRNILVNGRTIEDAFEDKIVKLLENYKDDQEYIKSFFKATQNVKYLERSKLNIWTDEVNFDNLEVYESEYIKPNELTGLKLLFLNYQPETKRIRNKMKI